MKLTRWVIAGVISLLFLSLLAGCAAFIKGDRKEHYASSTVEYLYPSQEVVNVPTIPHLSLPLRVGVAFVPGADGITGKSVLSEKEKMDLMERIVPEFRKLPFVKDIEIIPSAYLTRGGGFTNVDQIRTMYGIDVIALLSYDQVQHTDQGLLSLSYWTIIGAYIIEGEKNDTSTMVDAAVYDIASRKMLFRAPGTNHIKNAATPINLSEQLRIDSYDGFFSASDDLIINLQNELERFKVKVKEMPQEYVVKHKTGYTGGGSVGGAFALLLLSLGGLALWRGRNR
ncbi:MAG: rhombotarget lipoprotein [Deltaproteobacteria bacterium]|nr:MAG: rhombotarget lipoprotein [Deltaproteobacteria bacterium]